ncbi:MAG: twin transmembrane helix small protein [Gammaproteobacteria bacterium]
MFKLLIVLTLLVILFTLGSALFHMAKGKGDPERMVKALTWRIGLSFALFAVIALAYFMGWIEPQQPQFLREG